MPLGDTSRRGLSWPGAVEAVLSYGVRGRTAFLDGSVDRAAMCVQPIHHLQTAELLVVEVEEHRATVKDGLDLQVP